MKCGLRMPSVRNEAWLESVVSSEYDGFLKRCLNKKLSATKFDLFSRVLGYLVRQIYVSVVLLV